MMPLPQVSLERQSAEQPSPDVWLPSSQTSPLVLSVIVSPQRCGRQFVRHSAFGLLYLGPPRSQPSPFEVLSLLPSPHLGSLHAERHGAFGVFAFAPPASHCSPLTVST